MTAEVATRRLSPILGVVLAPNAGPMTLDGTNSFVLGDPARGSVAVLDPGPLDDHHLRQIMIMAGGRVEMILISHRHLDHTEGADRLSIMASCDVRAADPSWQRGDLGLGDGDRVELGGATLTVVSTPGHTSDSCSFLLAPTAPTNDVRTALLTGDMVLGRGTTVITYPDGDLADYLQSLDVMEAAVQEHDVRQLLPAHGPMINNPLETLRFYRRHRLERLDQVRAALAAGDSTAEQVVARVYADVDHAVWPAATQSVRAQLDYLKGRP